MPVLAIGVLVAAYGGVLFVTFKATGALVDGAFWLNDKRREQKARRR